MYYFDHSATSPVADSTIAVYGEILSKYFANPSSAHYLGEETSALLKQARKQVADLLGYSSEEIYFTSSGTEANNWVLQKVAPAIRRLHPQKTCLLVSSIEHASISQLLPYLKSLGFEIDLLAVDEWGRIDLEDLKAKLSEDVALVSTMAVNNEVGSLQPLEEMASIFAQWPQLIWHVDGVQAVTTQFDLILNERIDLLTLSGHKFHAPRGTGILACRQRVSLEPLLYGGGQEMGQRSSTENLAGIVTTARCLREAYEGQAASQAKLAGFRQQIVSQLQDLGWQVYGGETTSEHIICAGLAGIPGEVMLHALEKFEVIVSTTSACASRKHQEHSTLRAMGVEAKESESAIRMSMADTTTEEEVQVLCSALDQVTRKFKS